MTETTFPDTKWGAAKKGKTENSKIWGKCKPVQGVRGNERKGRRVKKRTKKKRGGVG